MAARNDILIFHRHGCLSPQLPELLHDKGFSSQSVIKSRDLLKALASLNSPILVTDCGRSSDEAETAIRELTELKALHSLPAVFVGKAISQLEGMARELFFNALVTLKAPCSKNDILEAVQLLAESYQKLDAPPTKTSANESEKTAPSDEAPIENIHKIYQAANSIAELYFSKLAKDAAGVQNLNGNSYSSTRIDSQYLEQQGYLPTNITARQEAKALLESTDEWSRLHLCRTNFITNQFASTMGIKSTLLEDTRSASLLFPASFLPGSSRLLRSNYTRPQAAATRQELCEQLKQSAQQLASNMKLSQLAEIVSTMGKLIGREAVVGDDDLSLTASSIVAADLIDRICYHSGYWDPRAAYMLLRRTRRGNLSDVHPRVLCLLIRFVAEAVSARSPAFMIPKDKRNDPELLKQARAIKEAQISKNEKKISIAELLPGMRLTRPIIAFDGAQILTGGVLLDQDLIWRIWQMAALRPLNMPMVITSD